MIALSPCRAPMPHVLCLLAFALRSAGTPVTIGGGMTPSFALVMVDICEEFFFPYEVVGGAHTANEHGQ